MISEARGMEVGSNVPQMPQNPPYIWGRGLIDHERVFSSCSFQSVIWKWAISASLRWHRNLGPPSSFSERRVQGYRTGNRPKEIHYHPVSWTSLSREGRFSWEARLSPSKHRSRTQGVGSWDEETEQPPPGQALAPWWPQGQWGQPLQGLLGAAPLISTSSQFPLLSFFLPDPSKSK